MAAGEFTIRDVLQGKVLPSPLGHLFEVMRRVSNYETSVILLDIWAYFHVSEDSVGKNGWCFVVFFAARESDAEAAVSAGGMSPAEHDERCSAPR